VNVVVRCGVVRDTALHDGLRQGTSSTEVLNVGDAMIKSVTMRMAHIASRWDAMMRSVTMCVALAAHIASRCDQCGHVKGPPRAGASARYPHTKQTAHVLG
jgi:hypothetical protein